MFAGKKSRNRTGDGRDGLLGHVAYDTDAENLAEG